MQGNHLHNNFFDSEIHNVIDDDKIKQFKIEEFYCINELTSFMVKVQFGKQCHNFLKKEFKTKTSESGFV